MSPVRPSKVPRLIVLTIALMSFVFMAPAAFAAQHADIDQCENGPLDAPHACAFTAVNPDPWVNGNLNGSKAHYSEDQVVPFRLVMTGLTPGAHTTTIEWDTLKGGKHAYDFIYNYNYTEKTADACVGIASCSLGSVSYRAIPLDPAVPPAYQTTSMPSSGTGHDGEMALFGGTLTAISVPIHSGATDDPARVTVSFTVPAGTTTAVLAWGGHIADHHDWGAGSAAADISGSPYHMRSLDLDGSGGNQDRSISSDAIYFPSTITIVKDINVNSGQDFGFTTTGGLTPATFTLDDDADGTLSDTQAYPPITSQTKNTYSVTEGTQSGWTLGSITCVTVAAGSAAVNDQTISLGDRKVTIPLDEGEDITCTFHNNAVLPTLTVIKHVINDDGGTKDADDFQMHVANPGATPANFPGAESPGTDVTVDAGHYVVTETEDSVGYTASYSAGCEGDLAFGQSATCTVTNNDKPGTLNVIKHVINDDGGTKVAADFPIAVTGTNPSPSSFNGSENGTNVSIGAGAYNATETEDPGYAASYSADCSGTIANGVTKTCTITNNDKPAKLTVIKHVINDDGGTKVAGDFPIQVTGTSPAPAAFNGSENGTDVTIGAGSYNATETQDPAYAASYSADCTGTIANGVTKTCTITNNDKAVSIDVEKQVSTTAGGPFVDGPVQAHVGDTLYFEMTVENTGAAPLTLVFSDPKCDAGTLSGPTGDGAPAGSLDPGEKWTFHCSHVVTAADGAAGSFDNVATGTGTSGSGGSDSDTDHAGGTILVPGINVVKDGPAQAYHGDSVTYTFTVTNTGNTPLSAVKVEDDRCSPVSADPTSRSNDDGDALLENPGTNGTSSEVWVFSCTTTIGAHAAGEADPIVNTATATGTDPLGQDVTDTDQHSTALIDPAIHIEKTGPATSEAGKDIGYTLTVTNPGETAIVGESLKVTDKQCAAPPQLVAKRRGDAADASPSTLDPGDSWIYGCFVSTQVGQAGPVVNVAEACGTDVNGHAVPCDDDDATTTLTQPAIQVLPETVVSGAAKLAGPAGCVRKAFKVRITGRQIAKVKITIDGRTVKTFRNAAGTGKRFVLSVNPARYGKGIHRLQAQVTYSAKSETRPRTLRMAFERCLRQAIQPEFTG